MAWFVAALTLPATAAYLLVACCDRGAPRGAATFLLRLCLAVGLGLGAFLLHVFSLVAFCRAPGGTYHVFDLAAFAAIAAIALLALVCRKDLWCGRLACIVQPGRLHHNTSQPGRLHHNTSQPKRLHHKDVDALLSSARWYRFLQVAMIACLIFAVSGVVGIYWKDPLGDWDAWGIWNRRARAIFNAGDQWRQAFSPTFGHTDYPLLTPCANVRLWSYLGVDPSWTPWLVGCLFTFATLGVLAAGVTRLRSRSQGLLAGMTLLGIASFLQQGAWQYADVPLACFMLSAVLLLALHDAAERPQWGFVALSGLMAGMAAWTKNEGLLFLLVLPAARCGAVWRPGRTRVFLREAICWSAGVAPLAAIVVLQKVCLAGDNDLVVGQGWDATLARLLDPWRYWCIVQTLVVLVFRMARPFSIVLPLCFLFLGTAQGRRRGAAALPTIAGAMLLMLAGYFWIYLTTPWDLSWHLATSANRLLLHLWPSALLCVFLYLATPEELTTP